MSKFICVHIKSESMMKSILIQRDQISLIEGHEMGFSVLSLKDGLKLEITDSMDDICKQIFGPSTFTDRIRYLLNL